MGTRTSDSEKRPTPPRRKLVEVEPKTPPPVAPQK